MNISIFIEIDPNSIKLIILEKIFLIILDIVIKDTKVCINFAIYVLNG